MRKTLKLCAVVLATLLLSQVGTADKPNIYRYDFAADCNLKGNWKFKAGINGVPEPRIYLRDEPTAENGSVVVMDCDHATGTYVTIPMPVDLKKMPYMRWRWRVIKPIVLQPGQAEPDDQAVVIYVGDGAMLRKAVAYRWEVNTPIGKGKFYSYAFGAVKIQSYCLRNSETPCGEWVEEERNVLEDFREAFHRNPDRKFALTIGANTQHAKATTIVEIDYIEFSDQPRMKK